MTGKMFNLGRTLSPPSSASVKSKKLQALWMVLLKFEQLLYAYLL